MKNKYVTFLLIALLLAFALGLLYWGIFILDNFSNKISAFAIVAAIFTTIISVYTITLNNDKVKERELEYHKLKEKQKVFEHFYNSLFIAFSQERKEKSLTTKQKELYKKKSDEEVVDELLKFKKGIMNWGSPRLIKKFIHYDNCIVNNVTNKNKDIFKEVNTFLKELRFELGFKNDKNLDLLSILLSPSARTEFKEKGMI